MVREHYVYAYLREDGSPYYIGKGKENRILKKHSIAVPPKERIQFIANHLTNEEANNFEKLLISKLGRKDLGAGILRNRTDGGDGGDTSLYIDYSSMDYSKVVERMKTQNPSWDEDVQKKRKATNYGSKISKKLKGVQKTEEHKEKVREGVKRAYAEGRLTSVFSTDNPLKKHKYLWWNDGQTNKRIKEGDSVPEGYVRGRLTPWQ